jgi:hypothetical protein
MSNFLGWEHLLVVGFAAEFLCSLCVETAGPPVLDLHVAHTETLPDGQIRELIDCPQDKVGSLIGTRGAVIQDMQTRCGCKIYIDQNFPDGVPRKVILTGSSTWPWDFRCFVQQTDLCMSVLFFRSVGRPREKAHRARHARRPDRAAHAAWPCGVADH